MRYTVKQNLLIVFILGLSTLAAAGWFLYQSASSLLLIVASRGPAYETLAHLREMRSALKDIETAEREFALTGKGLYREHYAGAAEMIGKAIDAVHSQTSPDPAWRRDLDLLRTLLHQRLEAIDLISEARKKEGRRAAGGLALKQKENRLAKNIRGVLSDMEGREKGKLARHDDVVRRGMREAGYAVAAGGAAALAVVMLALIIILRELSRIRRIEEGMVKLAFSLDHVADLVAITDARGKIEFVNQAVEETTGYAREDLVGKGREIWGAGKYNKEYFDHVRHAVLGGRSHEEVVAGRKKSGELFYARETVTPLEDRKGKLSRLIHTAKDITLQKHLQDELNYLAAYDPLTDIPNRTLFAERLGQKIESAKQSNRPLAVLIVDIDRFKYVNDVLGSEAGDDVLKWVAKKLRASVGLDDIVARLGSDEFGVILLEKARPADVADRVTGMQDTMLHNGRLIGMGDEVAVTISAGVAMYPENGEDAQTLMRNADFALSKAKSQGRNNVQFYTADIPARISEFVHLEKRLFSALKNDEYMVHYQPYHDLATSALGGAEALIKWRDKDLGVVSPQKFIPSLEDTGMIIDVGEWVLKTACRQVREWENGRPAFPVSVNLSLIQFRHKYLVNMVSDTISEYELDPQRLTLELTESIFMHDIDFATSVLKRLKNIGVSISVDDFGTGYSSLSYLKKLPVDNVKIDISFVRDVTLDPDAASIITAITSMARSLNLKTIAEGVETEEQRNVLRLLRCDMGQGYLFSPPLAAKEFVKYMG